MKVLVQTPTGYDLKANVHRYLAFLRSKTGTVSDQRTRLLKSQADMQELKVRQREGELLTKHSVAKYIFAMVRQARDQFQNVPDRVAGICAAESDQAAIHAILTKEIHQVLEDLSHASDEKPTPTTP